MKNELRITLLSLVFGALGGYLGNKIQFSFPGAAQAATPQVQQATAFNLVDAQGRLRAQLAMGTEGSPGLWIMDAQSKSRVNVGVYGDGTGFIVLNDQKGNANQILRSFGSDETPLHIFKTGGQDMMIMGLNPDSKKTPFQFFYDEKRGRKIQFGVYSGP